MLGRCTGFYKGGFCGLRLTSHYNFTVSLSDFVKSGKRKIYVGNKEDKKALLTAIDQITSGVTASPG